MVLLRGWCPVGSAVGRGEVEEGSGRYGTCVETRTLQSCARTGLVERREQESRRANIAG